MPQMIVVTDLTRFKRKDIVCLAGIDPQTNKCIRPLPYIRTESCKKLKIFPGGKLVGEFTPSNKRGKPHTEDSNHNGNITFHGAASSSVFKKVLDDSRFESVNDGFGFDLEVGQKSIPDTHRGPRSIITLQVNPDALEVVPNNYDKGKIKAHFHDPSGHKFSYVAITDLGFHDYAMEHHARNELAELNAWLHRQKHLYLRIGLGQPFNGAFWLQVNGIYTFPDKHPLVRSYTD